MNKKFEQQMLNVLTEIRDRLPLTPGTVKKIENDRFIRNPDGSVIDKSTSLMWGPTFEKEMTFADAEKACKDFNLGGCQDWRLPTVKEFISLVDYDKRDPAINKEFFPDTKSSYYWTSTPLCGGSDSGWVVGFGIGGVGNGYRHISYFVRPVRQVKLIV